jgi:hypothetical protein
LLVRHLARGRPTLDENGGDPHQDVIAGAAKRSAAIWSRTIHQIATSLALLAMTRVTSPLFVSS